MLSSPSFSAGRRPGLVGGNGEGYSVLVLRVRVDLAVPRGRDQTLSAGRERSGLGRK